jgi:hypothetical protein
MYSLPIADWDNWAVFDKTASYIVFVNALNTPPHIAFIHQNHFYSYGVKGTKEIQDAYNLLQKYQRKNIPVVLFELQVQLHTNIIQKAFAQYSHLDTGSSCLRPIKDILEAHNTDIGHTTYAYELVLFLYAKKIISQICAYSCKSPHEVQSELLLPEYDQGDIDVCVNELKVLR